MLTPEVLLKPFNCDLSPHFAEKAEKCFYLPYTLISRTEVIVLIEASTLFCQHLALHKIEVTSAPCDAVRVTKLPFSSQNGIH